MSRGIIFFDFDDTLYSHKTQTVPESSLRALAELKDAGHSIVIATGRGGESLGFIESRIDAALGQKVVEAYIILNGQIVIADGNVIFERFIELPSLEGIADTSKKNGIAYGGYVRDGIVVNVINERVVAVWGNFNRPLPVEEPDFERRMKLYQGHLYITKEEVGLFDGYLDDFLINWPDKYGANLIPRKAGKSQAIKWYADEFGWDLEDAYAFGDGFNDEDMLAVVGHGIAMGNAPDNVKAVAEFVTGTTDEDGVRRGLERFGLLPR